jgi:hypothetical protein
MRNNLSVRQLQRFTSAELATMRDRTASRNYSPERDAFRREHERHRAWGLVQRHAQCMRRSRASDRAAQAPSVTEHSHQGPSQHPPPPLAPSTAAPAPLPPALSSGLSGSGWAGLLQVLSWGLSRSGSAVSVSGALSSELSASGLASLPQVLVPELSASGSGPLRPEPSSHASSPRLLTAVPTAPSNRGSRPPRLVPSILRVRTAAHSSGTNRPTSTPRTHQPNLEVVLTAALTPTSADGSPCSVANSTPGGSNRSRCRTDQLGVAGQFDRQPPPVAHTVAKPRGRPSRTSQQGSVIRHASNGRRHHRGEASSKNFRFPQGEGGDRIRIHYCRLRIPIHCYQRIPP